MTNTKLIPEIYGEAKYCFLSTPDTFFDEKEGQYSVTLNVPKANAGGLIRDINEVIKAELANGESLDTAKKPYGVEGDLVWFKTKTKFKPTLWDKNQKKIEDSVNVWKGSTMWIKCTASGYRKNGVGATLLLSGVQIDKLVEGTAEGTGACPFPVRAPRIKLNQPITESVLPAPQKAAY